MNKDCLICVYCTVCNERKKDETILDCCIPEAPLRDKQRSAYHAGGIELYAAVTNDYIMKLKAQSEYWKREIKES